MSTSFSNPSDLLGLDRFMPVLGRQLELRFRDTTLWPEANPENEI
jgi:hypothetical protein